MANRKAGSSSITTKIDLKHINDPEKIRIIKIMERFFEAYVPLDLVYDKYPQESGHPLATLGPMIQCARDQKEMSQKLLDELLDLFLGVFPDANSISPLAYGNKPFFSSLA